MFLVPKTLSINFECLTMSHSMGKCHFEFSKRMPHSDTPVAATSTRPTSDPKRTIQLWATINSPFPFKFGWHQWKLLNCSRPQVVIELNEEKETWKRTTIATATKFNCVDAHEVQSDKSLNSIESNWMEAWALWAATRHNRHIRICDDLKRCLVRHRGRDHKATTCVWVCRLHFVLESSQFHFTHSTSIRRFVQMDDGAGVRRICICTPSSSTIRPYPHILLQRRGEDVEDEAREEEEITISTINVERMRLAWCWGWLVGLNIRRMWIACKLICVRQQTTKENVNCGRQIV